jgi:hypothetical protein
LPLDHARLQQEFEESDYRRVWRVAGWAAMSRMNMAEREREKAYMDQHPGEPNPWNEFPTP